MKRLDCLTPKGRQAIADARRGLDMIGRQYLETSQRGASRIDGFFLNDSRTIVTGVYEAKARDITLSVLKVEYKNEWLVTWDKIQCAIDVARSLSVPFYGVIYLTRDGICLRLRITNSAGDEIVPIRTDFTQTAKTVNGGQIVRENAFIDISSAEIYYPSRQEHPRNPYRPNFQEMFDAVNAV